MKLMVNGEEKTTDSLPSAPLLWVLRDELGLTGTKYGCGVGLCGSCTVHIDGQAVRSCVTPLSEVEGKEVRTIEGLATVQEDGSIALHVVQQAFIDEQTPQCGWCMSGQIMTAAAYLEENPSPNDDDIVDAMSENFCRCGSYTRIFRAVKRAAQETAAAPTLERVS